jgi:GNAT superfamily N-acetyltransferase
MTSLSIREAQSSDLESLLQLYAHLNPGDTFPPIDEAQKIWARLLALPDTTVFIGEDCGQPVTTCTLVITPNLTRGGRPYAIIENVVTIADRRGRGFGKAILAEAVRRATQEKCYKIVLTTGSKRESTLAFYEKAGFKRNTRTVFEIRA